eukprot:CAMPEP_0119267840 /NCGR_PEP_ID=MMETSP1329-20130426/5833_1 /TAXON_ID=114041 /ORGANISM="Genus nov. species nov., Strain RCC1024" /LENGTH=43 /DNA_ID= /DNA_START= /DNA_END= /DNA_ORIENTATION=
MKNERSQSDDAAARLIVAVRRAEAAAAETDQRKAIKHYEKAIK